MVYRVSKSRFRVRSGYHKLGFRSGTGITLLFEPRYRVPSGNIRVSESLENLSKMIILFIYVNKFLQKVPNYLLFLFLLKQELFFRKIMNFFFFKFTFFVQNNKYFRKILPLIAFQLLFGYPPGNKLGSGSVPGNT